jgi:hypothetical protein
MRVAPASRKTVMAGTRGTARRLRGRRLRSDNGLIKVHAADSRGRALGAQPPRDDRDWAARPGAQSEATGPPSVRDLECQDRNWNAKIVKCRAWLTVDSGTQNRPSLGRRLSQNLAGSTLERARCLGGIRSPRGALLRPAARHARHALAINWCRHRSAAPARPPRYRG